MEFSLGKLYYVAEKTLYLRTKDTLLLVCNAPHRLSYLICVHILILALALNLLLLQKFFTIENRHDNIIDNANARSDRVGERKNDLVAEEDDEECLLSTEILAYGEDFESNGKVMLCSCVDFKSYLFLLECDNFFVTY